MNTRKLGHSKRQHLAHNGLPSNIERCLQCGRQMLCNWLRRGNQFYSEYTCSIQVSFVFLFAFVSRWPFSKMARGFSLTLSSHTHTFDWTRIRYTHPLLSATSYFESFFYSSSSSFSLDCLFVSFFINSMSSSQCLIFFVCRSPRFRSFATIYAMKMLSTHARKLWSRWIFFPSFMYDII